MERGQLLGLNYEIPRNQPFVPQQQMAQGVAPIPVGEDDIPDEPEGLAIRREKTSKLLDNYGLLKRYTESMAKKGINVWEPDYSQEGGGPEFQTYLNLEAEVRYATEELKNELHAEQQALPYFLQNKAGLRQGVNPQDAMISQGDAVSYEPLPFVEQANKFSGQNTYTQGDENKFNQAYFQRANQQIDQMVANGQLSPQEAQIQKAALQQNVHATSPQQLNPEAKNKPRFLSLHKNITNFTRGAWTPGSFQTGVVKGKTYEINPENRGLRFGKGEVRDKNGNVSRTVDKVLKQALKDELGNVYYQYEDPDLPLELVSNLPPDKIVSRHIASDDSFGGANAVSTYYNELEQAGFINEDTRSASANSVFGAGAPQLAQDSKPTISTDRERQYIKDQYNKLVNGDGDFNILNFTAPNGTVVKFKYDDDGDSKEDGVHISNWKELGMNQENRKKNLSFDDILQIMDDHGFWNKVIEQKKGSTTQKSSTPDNLTARQQKAIVQFKIQTKREPSPSELTRLLEKFK